MNAGKQESKLHIHDNAVARQLIGNQHHAEGWRQIQLILCNMHCLKAGHNARVKYIQLRKI